MIDWRFILNPDTDNLEIDEPVGWADIAFEIVRDKKFHGISIAYSLSEIKLVGEGAIFLKTEYELNGSDADVKIQIIAICDDEDQDDETFQLDFGRYKERCGEECSVSIGIEDISCFTIFNNNFDKKVDLLSDVAFDKTTVLEEYEGLEKGIVLNGKALLLQNRAEDNVGTTYMLSDDIEWACGSCVGDSWSGYLLPALPLTNFASFGSFEPSPIIALLRECGANNHPPYPDDVTVNTTELVNNARCELSDPVISFRMKGNINQQINDNTGNPGILLRAKIFKLSVGDDGGTCSTPGDWVELYSSDLIDTRGLDTGVHTFDLSATITEPVTQGDLFHFGFFFAVNRISQIDFTEMNQDVETFFDMTSEALCEPTDATVFLIHEALSRVTESMTNNCLALKSTYFGRTDSEPTAYDNDGCGGLECLTTGLFIRRAPNPTFFLSMKDALTGLQAIHNIGFGLQRESGVELLRVEKMEYFYQDFQLLDASDLNVQTKAVAAEEIPGTILGGYEKWEIEDINGLDEFNSKREYRLTIKNAKTTIDFRCKFVAGGYAIEITRLQSFAETGAADTKYDNETFIICLDRDTYGYVYPYVAGSLVVEQGGITSPANMFDPDTVINFRISPIRNMMRLAKTIFGAYRIHTDSESKIILQSGDGNLLAEGYISLDDCTPENGVVGESDDIVDDIFEREEDVTPIIRPESIIFDYPMSLSDFKRIKANPYGYINHCDGRGYITKVIYKPNDGKASFELRNIYD